MVDITEWEDIPIEIRDEFFAYFLEIHDEEEENAVPGAEACEGPDDCFVKIGPDRMWELYSEWIQETLLWTRLESGSPYDDDGRCCQ